MSGDDEDSWIYDSVVGFLNSPVWMVPIESFVDQHCLVFDSGTEDNQEYHVLHDDYKQLVEELLESFTSDLHITSSQFIAGCNKGRALGGTYTQGFTCLHSLVPGGSKQPIRTQYLGHVTGYQPIRDQYLGHMTGYQPIRDQYNTWRAGNNDSLVRPSHITIAQAEDPIMCGSTQS
eukprot:sb/3471911/